MAGLDNPMAEGAGRPRPEFDEQIPEGLGVIAAINRYRTESETARVGRRLRGDKNWRLYLGQQDWSHKQPGQSREFLPKVPVAVEQMSSMVKRALVQFGNYFSVSVDAEMVKLIDGSQLREIMKSFLNKLWAPNGQTTTFPTIISDAVKQALLKSLLILKVHGGYVKKRQYWFEAGSQQELQALEYDEWRLRIDLVRFEDYYPDPSGNNLYEIHRVERDLHEVLEMAKGPNPIYDPKAVAQLVGTTQERPEDEKLSESDRNQDETISPSFRRRVVIDEFWGTLLNNKGEVAHRNVVATVANEQFLIRPPEPNPFWHQESPFVVAPLLRVPHSVWHKALYDHASDLNIAINELYNLIIDGGMAAVWGISQLRVEDLEDPSQVEGGIRQGMTLAVKQTLPHNAKVFERVSEGAIPSEANIVFESLNREFGQAAMTNELKLGTMPPKQVLATEVVEAGSGINMMFDGVVADLENAVMTPTLTKAFLTILQMADQLPDEVFSFMDNKRTALTIFRAQPEERFALFAGRTRFKVDGLSATLSRALDFQKLMALLQVVGVNPMLMQAFLVKYSPTKLLDYLMTILNINSGMLERPPEEVEQFMSELGGMAGASQMIQGGPKTSRGEPGGVASGPGSQGDQQTGGIQQRAQPAAGPKAAGGFGVG